MKTFRTIAELRKEIAGLKAKGKRIGFVPTMGALHAGHLSLIELAKAHCDTVVASIFVNPTQFAPHEDFDAYPRPEVADLVALQEKKVDIAYLPQVKEMYPGGYPKGFNTRISVGDIGTLLEGAVRPHFFDGVALIVSKLFQQVIPDIAVFGEKDYQQLQVIRQLVRDLNMPVEVFAAPIARDSNGLALSSRNAYLSEHARTHIAPGLHAVLTHIAAALKNGAAITSTLEKAKESLLEKGFEKVDYVELRHSETLLPLTSSAEPGILLAAAHLEGVRLLDNLRV